MPPKKAKKSKKYIVEKSSGRVIDRFIGEREGGLMNPSQPILLGSWYREYSKKHYRVHSTSRKIDFNRTIVKKRRK